MKTLTSDSLLAQVEQLPASNANAALVVRVADDPNATVASLGAAVLADQTLTTKVLQLANSAYFGLSREVGDASSAVGVLGFSTVRALALAQLAGGGDADIPKSFWARAGKVGVASGLLAATFGANRGESFAIGLLHDLGRPVLARLGVPVELAHPNCSHDVEAERAACGTDHSEVAARLFDVMELPEVFATAVASHHQPVAADAPAAVRLLAAARAVVDWDGVADLPDDLEIDADRAREVVQLLDADSAQLVAVLS